MSLKLALCCLPVALGCGGPAPDRASAKLEAEARTFSWRTPEEFDRLFLHVRDQHDPEVQGDLGQFGLTPDAVPFATVVDARDGRPVGRAVVDLTLIGPDGGDGGMYSFATADDGTVRGDRRLTPGRYQWNVIPDPETELRILNWDRSDSYFVVPDGGRAEQMTFRLEPVG